MPLNIAFVLHDPRDKPRVLTRVTVVTSFSQDVQAVIEQYEVVIAVRRLLKYMSTILEKLKRENCFNLEKQYSVLWL